MLPNKGGYLQGSADLSDLPGWQKLSRSLFVPSSIFQTVICLKVFGEDIKNKDDLSEVNGDQLATAPVEVGKGKVGNGLFDRRKVCVLMG